MAHGCLAVISNVCGNAEWLVDGVDCIKINRNPEALAHAVERLLKCEISLEKIGPCGSRTALRWFHLSSILPRIETELKAAMRAGGGPRRSTAKAHRIALLAEKMFQSLVHETAA